MDIVVFCCGNKCWCARCKIGKGNVGH